MGKKIEPVKQFLAHTKGKKLVIKLEHPYIFDPKLDLLLERTVDVPKELVWKAWTTPNQLVQWFCPLPWKTTHCEIDLVPGGKFHTIMTSPEGEQFPNTALFMSGESRI